VLRTHSFDSSLDDYKELLETLQLTLHRADDQLQRCSRRASPICDFTIDQADTFTMPANQPVTPHELYAQKSLPNSLDLPILPPNPEFERLYEETVVHFPDNTTAPFAAYLDYPRYAADDQGQGKQKGLQPGCESSERLHCKTKYQKSIFRKTSGLK
jgi:hypothetical protein